MGPWQVAVFRDGKACGSMQVAVTQEERVVRQQAGGSGDSQDADQLLGIYDLVVRPRLWAQEEPLQIPLAFQGAF